MSRTNRPTVEVSVRQAATAAKPPLPPYFVELIASLQKRAANAPTEGDRDGAAERLRYYLAYCARTWAMPNSPSPPGQACPAPPYSTATTASGLPRS